MNNNKRFTPIVIAMSIVLGILIGTFYANHFSGNRLSIINTGSNKLNYLLQLIDNNYVDTVDMASLVEDAMPEILSELDPHSSYIGAKDAEEASEDLKGSFSGIGVSFTIQDDTVNVLSLTPGGPAEKVGLLAGDRIALIGYKAQDGEMMAQKIINLTSLLGKWTSLDKNFDLLEGGEVKNNVKAETNPWTSWKILNGKLLLNKDTFAIDKLGSDSLMLENTQGIYVFKRQE